MNKKLIRLTESDLHRIVKESVGKILKEMDLTPKWSGDGLHGYMQRSHTPNSSRNRRPIVPQRNVEEHEEEIGPTVYRIMRVVSVEPNTDKPSYYGKYKIGVTFDDEPDGYIRYQYTNVKHKVGQRFNQEFDTESKSQSTNRIVLESVNKILKEDVDYGIQPYTVVVGGMREGQPFDDIYEAIEYAEQWHSYITNSGEHENITIYDGNDEDVWSVGHFR